MAFSKSRRDVIARRTLPKQSPNFAGEETASSQKTLLAVTFVFLEKAIRRTPVIIPTHTRAGYNGPSRGYYLFMQENAIMPESIQCSTVLPAGPERIYRAWLDSAEHAAFTGSPAYIEPDVGGAFTAWDG